MVAIVTGNGLGLERSSAKVLGSRWQLGQAALGRANDNVYVNAANGNLVIQNTDEIILGRGVDDIVARTYNSQGTFNDDNGDNWRPSFQRVVTGLTGTVNTAGSTVKRYDWDGSDVTYTYDATKAAYVAKEGSGAYDTLTFSGSTWTWKDGSNRLTESYDNNNAGRITASVDADGQGLAFTYGANGLVSRITTAEGAYTDFTYTASNQLYQVVSTELDVPTNTTKTITRITYGYDSSNRLSTVTVDLTPGDNSIADGATYVTTYTYAGSSKRVTSITQTDGSVLQIGYDASNRVNQLTQTVASGVIRISTISYDTTNRITTVTDPMGQATQLAYDTSGQLTGVTMPPATSGATAQVASFTYDASGNVLTVNAGPNNTTTYTYDANGNVLSERDSAGNTVTRTYGSKNELLTETRYTVPDPDGAGSGQSSGPMTTRYAYDPENHLRYVVTDEGRVTEYEYQWWGGVSAIIEYVANKYDVSSLAANQSIADTTLDNWIASGVVDLTQINRTSQVHDAHGNVYVTDRYASTSSTAAGVTTTRAEYVETRTFYDQAGNLVQRNLGSTPTIEVYTYDGLNRLTSSSDAEGMSTSIQFNDASTTTVVTVGALTKTSVYNKAGELISYAEAGSGVTTATTAYAYDPDGRMRMETDPTGVKTYHMYDNVGRKIADIQGDGSVVEYVYNANNLLIETIRYKTPLTSTQLSSLAAANGNIDYSTIRPAQDANGGDRFEWRIYDNAQRLVEVIDMVGNARVYIYDGASRLTTSTVYASNISSSQLTTFETTPPTSIVYPYPSSNTANRVQRNFYDDDGNLIGTLDGEGYLTQNIYDGAGQKTQTIAYATQTDSTLQASGTFAQLLASVTTTTNSDDIHNWYVYDGRGLLRATIDGEGDLTRYTYDAYGNLSKKITGEQLDPSALIATAPTFGTLPTTTTPSTAVLETTTWTRNSYGQINTEVRTLASGTETDTYTYDSSHRLATLTKVSSNATYKRATNYRYDARGRITSELDGVGSAALAALGASPTQAQIDNVYATYGTTYVYDDADRLISKTEPNGTDATGNETLYYYDSDGNLTYSVNPLGEVMGYLYDVFGERTDTNVYGIRINTADTRWPLLKGGLVSNDANFTALMAPLQADTTTSNTHADYNSIGQVATEKDAIGYSTTYTYNVLHDLISVTDRNNVKTTYTYDHRGLRTSETQDVTLALLTSYTRDAFGRVIQVTDPSTSVRATDYDRAGRVHQTTDALSQTTTFSYDGRGNVLTKIDRNGKTTSFAYTAFNRQITVTTPENIITTTTYNPYGQALVITDGASRTMTYVYDADGNLKSVTNGLNQTVQDAYDYAGRLYQVTDERGFKTSYTYDAANRVLTRTVDTGGLALTTTYAYDAKGEVIQVTDPDNNVTTYTYDLDGRKLTQTVDPSGLAITTKYTYNKVGKVLTVVEAYGKTEARTTTYTYDNAYRLKTSKVSGTSVSGLITTYIYDKDDNVVVKQDAAGNYTHYVYDAENRLIYSVDGAGDVVANTYDGEGRTTSTRGYANRITNTSLLTSPSAIIAGDVTANVTTAANDHLVSYVYDNDGRLRFTVDAAGRPTEYVYDGAGNVIRKIEYAGSITAASSYSYAYVQGQIVSQGLASLANNEITRAVYDAANREAYTIDALGQVTYFRRDASGNVLNRYVYANAYTASDDPTAAAMQTWVSTNASSANDRVTRYRYDNAGRLVYEVDALGYVTEHQYDGLRNVTANIRYAAAYSVYDTTTTASLKSTIGALPASAVVTGFTYDHAGRLTDITDAEAYVTHMVLNGVGLATQTTRAYGTADASTTQRVYDGAGRVTSETVAYGVSGVAMTTAYTYDGMGRVLTATIGGSTTTDSYDGAGRLASENQASLTSASYNYDGVGDALSSTDGVGTTITRTYDAFGHVLTVNTPLDAAGVPFTTNTYDLLGNLVQTKDGRGNSGYFYYDKLNRLKLQVDPVGIATETTYTRGVAVASVIQHSVATTGATATTPPTVTNSTSDATTTFARDKLDRLTGVTDAMSFTESYILDAFGNRQTVTNKLGGVTTNSYDKRGLLLQESKAVTWTNADGTAGSATIVNKYVYDGRGNRTQIIEAYGAPEARTTNYTYSKADLLTKKTGDAVTVTDQTTFATTTGVVPGESYQYDNRGNLIEVDQLSNSTAVSRTLYYYDLANRRTSQIDALGTMTAWDYDANNNVQAERTYSGTMQLPATPGGTAPSNTSSYRETTYDYDVMNRLTDTYVTGALRTGSYSGTSYSSSPSSVIATHRTYDKAGNLIQETDGAGNSTYTFYDAAGRVTARVDAEKYATFYTLDFQGNVLKEERFATALASVTAGTLPAKPASSADDRITNFTYDSNGRRLSETRTGVVAWTVDPTTGALTAASTNATVSYSYNGLGEVIEKIEANLDTTDYTYDSFGRQTIETDAAFTDYQGTSVRLLTENSYDKLNNLTQTRLAQSTGASIVYSATNDRITTYTYGAGGRLATMTDASTFQRTYGYDAVGRVVKSQYSRVKSDGTSVTEADTWQYDKLGRVTQQAKATYANSSWSFGDRTQTQYDVYGEVTARGLNDLTQETYAYDAGGRVWKSNAGDGTVKLYYYDAAGRVTLTVGTSGRDNSAETTESMVTLLTNSGATAIGGTNVAGVTIIFTTYDKRGLQLSTREPFRQLNFNSDGTYNTGTIVHSRAYNAFGEVKSETNARNFTTSYTYNTMGRLIQKTSPLVAYTGEDGVNHNDADATAGTADDKVNPVEKYYYDISGRLVGTQDAEAVAAAALTSPSNPTFHTNTRRLLAGTGHGDDEALSTDEFHNDGGHSTTAYDVFGDVRTLTNELSKAETRTYDKMNRLVTLTRRGALLTENYSYDGLGQRIKHWNNILKNPDTTTAYEKTDYDVEGRVSSMVDFGGNQTNYTYLWDATIATTGLGTFGGWTKTTSDQATRRNASDITDYFGHAVSHTDFGGHVYSYGYDVAGRVATQTMKLFSTATTNASSTANTWFNTGKLGTSLITLNPGAATIQERSTSYGYDVEGSQVKQSYYVTDKAWNSTTSSYAQTAQTNYQNATVTYDALNRMASYSDTGGTAGGKQVTVNYEYDRNGNVRRTNAVYTAPYQTTTTTKDYYYLYDSMNRFTLVKGALSGGVISAGTDGSAITWDQAGQRHTATGKAMRWVQTGWESNGLDDPREVYGWQTVSETETYSYTDDGYLSNVAIASGGNNLTAATASINRVTYTRDGMGRVTSYFEYDADGYLVYSRTSMIYDAKSQLTSETTRQRQGTASKYIATWAYQNYAQSGITYNYGSGSTYAGGAIVSQRNLNDTTDANGNSSANTPDTTVTNSYVWWDQAKQSSISTATDGAAQANTSTFSYDVAGDITQVAVDNHDSSSTTTTYSTDADGRVLRRYQTSGSTVITDEYLYYFGGLRLGDDGSDGTDTANYAQAINSRYQTDRGVTADFDQAYDPISGNEATTPTRYVTQDGDTLASIAYAVWGDASLWYVLADANGMTSDTELAAGMTITIPDKVENVHNTSSTFRPYDPNKALGKIVPKLPLPIPPKQHGGCGLAQIFVAIIAIVVVAVVAPHLIAAVANVLAPAGTATATGLGLTGVTFEGMSMGVQVASTMIGGAMAGAAGSIVSQGVAMAMGVQDKFSWNQVGLAALGTAITGGLAKGGPLSGANWTAGAARGAVSSAATQGIGVATGMQDHFSWTSVAVAGVVSGVGYAVGDAMAALNAPPLVVDAVSGVAGGIAGAAAHSLIDGSDFGDNLMAALPDVISSTFGNAIARGLTSGGGGAAAGSSADDAQADNGDYFMEHFQKEYADGAFSQPYGNAPATLDPAWAAQASVSNAVLAGDLTAPNIVSISSAGPPSSDARAFQGHAEISSVDSRFGFDIGSTVITTNSGDRFTYSADIALDKTRLNITDVTSGNSASIDLRQGMTYSIPAFGMTVRAAGDLNAFDPGQSYVSMSPADMGRDVDAYLKTQFLENAGTFVQSAGAALADSTLAGTDFLFQSAFTLGAAGLGNQQAQQQVKMATVTTMDAVSYAMTHVPQVWNGVTSWAGKQWNGFQVSLAQGGTAPWAYAGNAVGNVGSFLLPSAEAREAEVLAGGVNGLAEVERVAQNEVSLTAAQLRNTPGVATVTGDLFPASGRWLDPNVPAPIPRQVGDALAGQTFDSFDDLRSAVWEQIGKDSDLNGVFSRANLAQLRAGNAPFAPSESLADGGAFGERFNLHHVDPISNGGAVYDLSNILIVSPRVHYHIHYGQGS